MRLEVTNSVNQKLKGSLKSHTITIALKIVLDGLVQEEQVGGIDTEWKGLTARAF